MTQPPSSDRIVTIDAVRGFAVLGILLLNIVSFAMPSYAYVDPSFYGGADGANWWAWAITFVLVDGKMRGLFAMLFGASMMLIAARARAAGEDETRVHHARMATLFAIGMAHAYLIWAGDILALYALCGTIAFAARRCRTSTLAAAAALLIALPLAIGAADHAAARRFEAHATRADAAPAIKAQWVHYRGALDRLRATIPAELAAFRGGWHDVQPMRATLAFDAQRAMLSGTIPETLAFMLGGMALFRSGFFSGGWTRRRYGYLLLLGYGIALPLYLPIVGWIDAARFDPITLLLVQPLHIALLCPALALAYAASVILMAQRAPSAWLTTRLAAAGRMALSNYILTSVVATGIFYGYGLGWFGWLERWQLYPVVLAIWALILLWSRRWLARFARGPIEWLWRSLARRLRPAAQAAASTDAVATRAQ